MRRAIVWGLVGFLGQAASAGEVDRARDLWKVGKYAESLEAFDALAAKPDRPAADRDAIALGRADVLDGTGEPDKALAVLREAAEAPGNKADNPDLWARIAEIQFTRGDWDGAEVSTKRALKAGPDHLPGRWVEARLLEARGDGEGAIKAFRWFVDYRNDHREALLKEPANLLLIGQAAERYARAKLRGEELRDELNNVITEIYEPATKADPNCWQANWLEGRLFLANYQEGDARKDLTRALKINPAAAEVIVTLGQADLQGYKLAAGRKKAERALEINPRMLAAQVLLADLNISDERFLDALENARKAVAENPRDEDGLARLAASARLLVDPLGAQAVESVAMANNPRPATFFAALAERLADRRKYHSAERAFLRSIAADPDRADTRIGLGMLYMQTGREAEARDLFDAAFDADPLNTRAANMRKILKHMEP